MKNAHFRDSNSPLSASNCISRSPQGVIQNHIQRNELAEKNDGLEDDVVARLPGLVVVALLRKERTGPAAEHFQ